MADEHGARLGGPTLGSNFQAAANHRATDDSTHLRFDKPLFAQLREALPAWRKLGANEQVLSWIEHGVEFDLLNTPPNFFHKQIAPGREE